MDEEKNTTVREQKLVVTNLQPVARKIDSLQIVNWLSFAQPVFMPVRGVFYRCFIAVWRGFHRCLGWH